MEKPDEETTRFIQEYWNSDHPDSEPLVVDGIWGAKTEAAISTEWLVLSLEIEAREAAQHRENLATALGRLSGNPLAILGQNFVDLVHTAKGLEAS